MQKTVVGVGPPPRATNSKEEAVIMRTWTEVWRSGQGRTSRVCTIEETPHGCAVDVFRGDACIYAAIYPTREQALRAAQDKTLRRRLNQPLAPLDAGRSLHGCSRATAHAARRSRFAAA